MGSRTLRGLGGAILTTLAGRSKVGGSGGKSRVLLSALRIPFI